MEPITLAMIATLAITKVFEKTGEILGEKAFEEASKLLSLLKRKAPDTANAIELAQTQPLDYGQAVLIGQQVEEVAKKDPEIAQSIEALANEAQPQLTTAIENWEGINIQGGTTTSGLLTPEKDISRFLADRTTPLDMMFCLHHRLREAHQNEWLLIQKLIRSYQNSRCSLLSAAGKLIGVESGENLLDYFIEANHNILHFACHCLSEELDIDTLLFTLLKDEGQEGEPLVIKLGAISFILVKDDKRFQCQPLVFLNACQSAGGTDALRKTFNLPQMFIKRGAEAVIVTACPVPDRFAAANTRKFMVGHGSNAIL